MDMILITLICIAWALHITTAIIAAFAYRDTGSTIAIAFGVTLSTIAIVSLLTGYTKYL